MTNLSGNNNQQPQEKEQIVDDDEANSVDEQALKNLTNQIMPLNESTNDYPNEEQIKMGNGHGLDLENAFDSKLVEPKPTKTANNTNNYASLTYYSNNDIAGSVNSPDISAKLSEYINSNLPHIEKSINNHLANTDSIMSLTTMNDTKETELTSNDDSNKTRTNSSFVKTHRKQMSDESFHSIRLNQNSNESTNNKRSIKKTTVSFNCFISISLYILFFPIFI